MPCYHPLAVYHDGNRIVFHNPTSMSSIGLNKPFNIPCGQCIGCRLNYAREWAIRCMHESVYYSRFLSKPSCFITLTFNDYYLKKFGKNLNKKIFQDFMKRLRMAYPDEDIRYFHSGEYGETNTKRPHYHALLFGIDFSDDPDRRKYNNPKNKKLQLYLSQKLTTLKDKNKFNSPVIGGLWKYGFSVIGNVSFESASYTARYITKKLTGKQKQEYPPYATMSRGKRDNNQGGLGYRWLKQYHKDVYNNDYVVMRGGFKSKPPRYYDKIYEAEINEKKFKEIKKHRIDNTYECATTLEHNKQLEKKEKYKLVQFQKLIRKLDKST